MKEAPKPKQQSSFSRNSKREEPENELSQVKLSSSKSPPPSNKSAPTKTVQRQPQPKKIVNQQRAPVKKPPPPKEEIIEEEEIIEDEEVIEEEVEIEVEVEEEEVIEDAPITKSSRSTSSNREELSEGKMKAVVRNGDGGPEVLRLGVVDKPNPRSNQVLVKVMAAGVNRADCLQRSGKKKKFEKKKF